MIGVIASLSRLHIFRLPQWRRFGSLLHEAACKGRQVTTRLQEVPFKVIKQFYQRSSGHALMLARILNHELSCTTAA
jgi:hypothetical protein